MKVLVLVSPSSWAMSEQAPSQPWDSSQLSHCRVKWCFQMWVVFSNFVCHWFNGITSFQKLFKNLVFLSLAIPNCKVYTTWLFQVLVLYPKISKNVFFLSLVIPSCKISIIWLFQVLVLYHKVSKNLVIPNLVLHYIFRKFGFPSFGYYITSFPKLGHSKFRYCIWHICWDKIWDTCGDKICYFDWLLFISRIYMYIIL